MNEVTTDALKALPRVPHATEDGLQEGKTHPALRRYQAEYKVVDWSEGLKLLAGRRSGEVPKIKGGVDDDSESMVLENAEMPNAAHKMRINPKSKVDPTKPKPRQISREDLMSAVPGSVEGMSDEPDDTLSGDTPKPIAENGFDPFLGGLPNQERDTRAVPEELVSDVMRLTKENARLSKLLMERDATVERLLKDNEELKDIGAYLKNRVRVNVGLSQLAFNISAIDLITSEYGIILLLPLTDDGMTFTPAAMSDVRLSCRDKGITADTSFTGVSFVSDELGVMGLAFILNPNAGKQTVVKPAPKPEPKPEPKPVKETMSDLVSSLAGR